MAELLHSSGARTVYDAHGDRGARLTLLLLHGIGADRRMWAPQVEPFTTAGYRVLIPDLLGHGGSSSLDSVGFEAWHRQVDELLEHCECEQVAVVGVSMGGVIAQSLVLDQPSRYSHLVLADTFCELFSLADKLAAKAQIVAFRLLSRRILAAAIGEAYRAPFASRARAYFTQCTLEADLHQLVLARKSINQADFRAALASIQVPSLVMVGTKLGAAFVQTNRKVAQAIPGSRFETIEQSMDPSNLVNPRVFNRLVLDFLAGDRTSPGVLSRLGDAEKAELGPS